MLFSAVFCSAQSDWLWTPLAPMPMSISNNAVAAAEVEGAEFVYSFGGIDTTKTSAGIVQTVMKYDVANDSWTTLPDLPDTLGKIAAGASEVNGIIYVLGGYYVFETAPFELSSNKIHRFDPSTDTFLSDGAPIPIPIDDQVQAVWRDSLIFSVTGWSDIENVPAVQIYDPSNDSWQVGTSTPATPQYEAFGASGSIVGDTIYYYGGASGGGFSAYPALRIGVIDPLDPTQVDWTFDGFSGLPAAYRAGSASIGDKVFWFGGSAVTYNFDGIAYNGSGGVSPLNRILEYDVVADEYTEGLDQEYAVMDLRGIGELSNNRFIIAGGMEEEQQVSNKAYLLEYSPLVDNLGEPEYENRYTLYPSVLESGEGVQLQSLSTSRPERVDIYDANGKYLSGIKVIGQTNRIDVPLSLPNGLYLIRIKDETQYQTLKLVLRR